MILKRYESPQSLKQWQSTKFARGAIFWITSQCALCKSQEAGSMCTVLKIRLFICLQFYSYFGIACILYTYVYMQSVWGVFTRGLFIYPYKFVFNSISVCISIDDIQTYLSIWYPKVFARLLPVAHIIMKHGIRTKRNLQFYSAPSLSILYVFILLYGLSILFVHFFFFLFMTFELFLGDLRVADNCASLTRLKLALNCFKAIK